MLELLPTSIALDLFALPFRVQEGDSRYGLGLDVLGDRFDIKAGASDTGGAFSIFEVQVAPRSRRPMHLHTREDEWFYVLSGTLVIEVDGIRHEVGAGDSVFAPRNIAHAIRNESEVPGRMLVIATPGGIEEFLSEAAARFPHGGAAYQADTWEQLSNKYGMYTVEEPADFAPCLS